MINTSIKIFFSFHFFYSCGPGFYINEGVYNHNNNSGNQYCNYSSIVSDATFSNSLDENPIVDDSSVSDSRNNGHTLKVRTNNSTQNKSVTGKFGNALDLDEDIDYAYQENVISNYPRNAFTMSLWFKHDGDLTGSNSQIITSMGRGTTNLFTFYIGEDTIGGGLARNFILNVKADNSSSSKITFSADSYLDNNWHHLVFTKSNETGVTIFIDSNQVGRNSTMATVDFVGWSEIFFGYDDSGSDRYLDGQLDEINFWNRELSSSEIQQLYECQPE